MKTSILVQENFSLAPLTTLKIGGKARFFVRAETESQVAAAFNFAEENDFPLFVLGGGSNVLVADEGFDGLVLQIAIKGVEISGDLVTAQAGEDWDGLVRLCVENDLQGVECLSGIPGLTGGTPVQNVGAYGQEVSETITRLRVFDRKSKEILELSNADCEFSYRASIFNTSAKNRFIVLSVAFALTKNGAPKIAYKDLQAYFGDQKPNLNETREAVLAIRRAKSMVIDERDPNARSAGSFFKNPIVTRDKFSEIVEIASEFGAASVPSFVVDEKTVKIPAAWLIENAGFHKGYIKNGAGISTLHTLAIINCGGASAKDVIALKNEIQTKVMEKFGIELKPEPIFIGF